MKLSRQTNMKWHTEAVIVIMDKIQHYKETGNVRKLAIYEAKLNEKKNIINKLADITKIKVTKSGKAITSKT